MVTRIACKVKTKRIAQRSTHAKRTLPAKSASRPQLERRNAHAKSATCFLPTVRRAKISTSVNSRIIHAAKPATTRLADSCELHITFSFVSDLMVSSFNRCGCITGYVLRPDLRTCKALGGAVKLIMANRGDIRQVTLSNNQYTSIIKGLPNAIALDYHYEKDLLFWSDVSADVIKQSFLNGTNVKDVIKWGLESPGGLAVDWIHELLFWTDSGTRRVEVSTFDGKLRAVLAANDLDKPRAIVIHPGK